MTTTDQNTTDLNTTSDRLLTEVERQQKYLDRLPDNYAFPLFNAAQALESQRRSGYRNTASAAREQTSCPSAFCAATSAGRNESETRYSDTQTNVRITELNGCVAQSHSAHDTTCLRGTGWVCTAPVAADAATASAAG